MHNDFISFLKKDISSILNVGDKRAKLFIKSGIKNYRDLLLHIPNDYIDRSYSPKIYDINNGDLVTLSLEVIEVDIIDKYYSKIPSKILCKNQTGSIELIYFNKIPLYIRQYFIAGTHLIISGKIVIQNGVYCIIHPDIVVRSDEKFKVLNMEAVYPKVQGITSKLISYLVKKITQTLPYCKDWLPQDLLKKYKWKTFSESIRELHFPLKINLENIKVARSRIAFDELLANQLCLKVLRKNLQNKSSKSIKFIGNLASNFLAELKFSLTKEQKIAIDAISQDQLDNKKMLRLLMGDVGCGKTVVAICAALNAIEAKKQVALMVPTEILAQQHWKNIICYTQSLGVKVDLLVGSLKSSEKKKVLENLSLGEVDLVVGTHALFQEKVLFKDLGLVIIDEQHRFGVKQRLNLLQKGDNVDLLMLSATPIPRTINMLNYGDMDVSIIKQKPRSNMEIATSMLSKSKIIELVERLKLVIEKDERVYWVCPLIEESEKLQLSYVEKSFKLLDEKLCDKVAMIHGKMKIEERDEVMQKFKSGEILVLVSTTVIEVGVDVPEATVMVIENAERFGLSQLHQLRGRVGRGVLKSYCILLYGNKLSLESKKRLSILCSIADGFKIAEKDLEFRGSGDYLGFRQSGETGFRFFDSLSHSSLVPIADEYESSIVNSNEIVVEELEILLKIFDKDVYFKEKNINLT